MRGIFSSRDHWGNRPAVWIIALVCLLSPALLYHLKSVRIDNDVTRWLPEHDPEAIVLNWFNSEFDHDSSLLFSWDSSVLGDPRIDRFKAALLREVDGRPEIPGIKEVTVPQDVVRRMQDNGISTEAAARRLVGVLIGSGFLKVRVADDQRSHADEIAAALRDELEAIVGKSVEVLPAVQLPDTSVGEDNSDEPAPLTLPWEMPQHDFQLQWRGLAAQGRQIEQAKAAISAFQFRGAPAIEDAFFASGAPIAVSISLNDDGDEQLRPTFAAIRAAAAEAGVPEEEMRMGGTPVGRERLGSEARRALWNREAPAWNLFYRSPVILSAIVGVLTSFILLRSARLAVLVVTVAVYTCLMVLALIPASGHNLNIVLVVLPNLLLVLTISGAIHVANYWKHARDQQLPHPVEHAVLTAFQPCLLASTTTAIGMASLMTAVLNPVREFGFYSSIGCLFSLVVILFVFPSLLQLWPGSMRPRVARAERDAENWRKLAHLVVQGRGLVTGVCVALFLVSVLGLRHFRTETKVIRYFPDHTRVVRDYDFLEESLAGIVSIECVVKFDAAGVAASDILQRMELVRTVQNTLEEHPWVSGSISLADFRPAAPAFPREGTSWDRVRYGRRVQRTENGIFREQAEASQQFTRHAARGLDVKAGARHVVVHPGEELWRIRSQAAVMGEVDYDVLMRELNSLVDQALQGQTGASQIITGMVPLFLRTQEAVLESLIESFGLAFLLIAVVMMILLRSVSAGLLAMLPNIFPVGVVFGLVSWARIPVDMGTMITASVALGIAIDGTLHLITWFRDGLREGKSRAEAVETALQHCGPAMWQTSISISLGMLMLAGAELLLIRRFGWLMASLIFVALIADVILMPALLGGWLGKLIERSLRRRSKLPEPPVPAAVPVEA